MRYLLILLLLNSFALFSHSKGSSHASAEWQIEAYGTAAPDFIGNYATIIGGNGEVLHEGSNGWTCQPGNTRLFQRWVGLMLMKPCHFVWMKMLLNL